MAAVLLPPRQEMIVMTKEGGGTTHIIRDRKIDIFYTYYILHVTRSIQQAEGHSTELRCVRH